MKDKIFNSYYPHITAEYKGQYLKVALDISMIEGKLPSDIIHKVIDWTERHYLELETEWNEMFKTTKLSKAA